MGYTGGNFFLTGREFEGRTVGEKNHGTGLVKMLLIVDLGKLLFPMDPKKIL